MSKIIDLIAVAGGATFSVGAFLQFGLGWGLMSGGLFLFLFALLSANAQKSSLNVSDTE